MPADDDIVTDAPLAPTPHAVEEARRIVRTFAAAIDPGLVDDACLVVSELVANAVLHADPPLVIRARRRGTGLRIEVVDGTPDRFPVASGTGLADVLALDVAEPTVDERLDVETMTGRGLTVVAALADGWGVEVGVETKTVWADVACAIERGRPVARGGRPYDERTGRVQLLALPARLVLAATAHVEDLVREFQVLAPDEGHRDPLAARLLRLAPTLRDPAYVPARQAIARGERLVSVSVPGDRESVLDLRAFVHVLDRLDERCRRGELLTMESPAEVIAFRHWYVDETARQVGGERACACPFPAVAADDPKVLLAAERAAGHFPVDGTRDVGLARRRLHLDPGPLESVAPQVAAILAETIGAASTSICVADLDTGTVALAWADHYPDDVMSDWTRFSLYDDLPASETIRTGRASFFRTVEERDARFPIFTHTPVVGDEAVAVLPVNDDSALVVGFAERRPFHQEERTFLLAMADALGPALEWSAPRR